MTENEAVESEKLIEKTSDLRDDLLVAVTKLEQYANALQKEVLRLKRIAEHRQAKI